MQEGRDDRELPPWRQITLYLLTLAILILCALILQPFFSAIVGAIVLAVVTEIPYNWLSTRILHRTTCATVALILVILAVIVPGFFLAQELGEQALKAIVSLRNPNAQNTITDYIGNHPALANRIEAFSASIDINNAARTTAAYVGSKAAMILGNSVHLITEMVVMLFLLFFLFRDRHLALAALRSIIPLREDETNELLERIDDTIYATFLGRLAIALVQGVLAGLAFWTLGVPGVILWSITLTAFAMIPAFGAFLVWGPIAIYLGLNGHWGKAALLAIWGGLIVSTIDNILYPILIGGHLRAHTAIILITILGGIAVFGPLGIILGPVIFTIASTLLDIWHARVSQIATQPDPLSSIHSL
ncbi:AI-2E family transporter [Tunturiibacter gelidoferens]|uniref:PurR-regulated permease PerM n=2 Tax=Tunturiibacter TaxID=3154218 RepID=A0ACC5NYJ9_9BACT|nr:AI-2E family transporter [Edaphobacter lichenicola]MBB5339545.1 putative PurR-regulated permease PerM [Edaphobacter lichenicola]NYF51177.1 putative PurR-regulated permease PerM [Edaphobacter lichenicola]